MDAGPFPHLQIWLQFQYLFMYISLFAEMPSDHLSPFSWRARSGEVGHLAGRSWPRDEWWGLCGCHAALPDGTRRSKSHRDPMKMITFDTQMTFYPRRDDAGSFFPLWHASLCGCYSSQIYHFNGEVVRPEDYLRDKYITVSSFRYRPNVIVPPTKSFKTNVLRYLIRSRDV